MKSVIKPLTGLILLLSLRAYGHVRIETLSETLFHVEISPQVLDAGPIINTPYVVSPLHGKISSSQIDTSINPKNDCITFIQKKSGLILTIVCPRLTNGTLQGLSLSKETTINIYGLGEQFRNPGQPNGDWMGQIRSSRLAAGNTLEGFEGGAVGNALFPIMYALGSGFDNYALYLDQLPSQTWDFSSDPFVVSTSGNTLRFYFIGGANLQALRHQYMDLVGHPLVPPKKAFGFWLSEFGYKSWNEIELKLKSLRSHHFPIDGFVLDAFWGGEFSTANPRNHIGAMTFDPQAFPDPERHVESLTQRGLGLMLHEDPFVNDWLPSFAAMKKADGFLKMCEGCGERMLSNYLGTVGIIDWTNDSTADFWHKNLRQPLIDMGITFHWTDFSEVDGYSGDDWFHGVKNFGHSTAENHNLFSFKWAESIARGYASLKQRQFILSRSGTPGVQRFGAALWSGDIASNMKSLAAHVNAQMHLSLSGIDYFGSDVGGYHRVALQGEINDVYTKWFAHSAAFDVPLRPHTNNWEKKYETSPDQIGDVEANFNNLKLRYELSPYYYSLAFRAHILGEPVFPPLIYYFQDDLNVRTMADEKMIGPWILVALSPTDGPVAKDVYLPRGDWVNYRDGQTFHSRGEKFYFNFLRSGHFELPYLVKTGAIIPVAKIDSLSMNILGQRVDESFDNSLRFKIFPSPQRTSFDHYEDDGVTQNYLKGIFTKSTLSQVESSKKLKVDLSASKRAIYLEVINRQASAITLNGDLLTQSKSKRSFAKAKGAAFINGENGNIQIFVPEALTSSKKIFEITEL